MTLHAGHRQQDSAAVRTLQGVKASLARTAIDIVTKAYDVDWVEEGQPAYGRAYARLMTLFRETPSLAPDRVPAMERFASAFEQIFLSIPHGVPVPMSPQLQFRFWNDGVHVERMVDWVITSTHRMSRLEAAQALYASLLEGHPSTIDDTHSWVPLTRYRATVDERDKLEKELSLAQEEVERLRKSLDMRTLQFLDEQISHHDYNESAASSMDMSESARFHNAVWKELSRLKDALSSYLKETQAP